MLSFRTVEPHTLELLKYLMADPYLEECRLVGGTASKLIGTQSNHTFRRKSGKLTGKSIETDSLPT